MGNTERVNRLRIALRENNWDLIVCALPKNVLLLTGYWPVVGTGVAIASADGKIALLVPEDEEDLAKHGWADDLRTFKPGSLDKLTSPAEAISAPLRELLANFSAGGMRIALEGRETSEPSSYAAMHLFGGQMHLLLQEIAPKSTLQAGDEALADLRAKKTNFEIDCIRRAAAIAGKAFCVGAERLNVGASEAQAANLFREPLSAGLAGDHLPLRADGFAWCMSGPNAALAAGAYARSRERKIETGDLVLVHMNSQADGYWTDLTRTFVMGKPDSRQVEMFNAVAAARQAAINAIRPGVEGSEVDKAARAVLQERGYGPHFKHSTGHGIGFSAIDANAKPRLHPVSKDKLEVGAVFNVEPAIYFEGYGGMRHCDMVTVTESGVEVLTPFQTNIEELVLHD